MEPVTRVEKLEAELKLAKLEDKFVLAKTEGKVTPKMKHAVREARQDFRDNYRSAPIVVVNPATVVSGAGVKAAKVVTS